MLNWQFFSHASKGLVIKMNSLQSIYNIPFTHSHSNPIYICFPIISSNVTCRGGMFWSVIKCKINVNVLGHSSADNWHREIWVEYPVAGASVLLNFTRRSSVFSHWTVVCLFTGMALHKAKLLKFSLTGTVNQWIQGIL